MHRAFQKHTENFNTFFVEGMDGFCTLRTQNPASASRAVSEDRKRSMMTLGALSGLMIIEGMKPGPLEPLFIQLLAHEGDFQSLTPELVEVWHPDLARTIKDWKRTGADGDISPFEAHLMSYHDIQVRTCLPSWFFIWF